MAATARSAELHAVAQRIAGALPPSVVEAVLTGSVSRGAADELSDIELLLVTEGAPGLAECSALAAGAGLAELGTWGPQGGPVQRVSGRCEGVPVELIWWPRAHAGPAVDALLDPADRSSTADALVHGVPLRSEGLLAAWQERLRTYPEALVAARSEDAALTWGGFHAAGLLTLLRPGERLPLAERMVDDAGRILRIVFALNRVWQPTSKRLAVRAAGLAVAPAGLAQRLDAALADPDARAGLAALTRLQAETVALAPDGPNVVRARAWLAEALELLGG